MNKIEFFNNINQYGGAVTAKINQGKMTVRRSGSSGIKYQKKDSSNSLSNHSKIVSNHSKIVSNHNDNDKSLKTGSNQNKNKNQNQNKNKKKNKNKYWDDGYGGQDTYYDNPYYDNLYYDNPYYYEHDNRQPIIYQENPQKIIYRNKQENSQNIDLTTIYMMFIIILIGIGIGSIAVSVRV
jgi:hypothetical protein